MKRSIIPAALVSFVVALLTVVGFSYFSTEDEPARVRVEHVENNPTRSILYQQNANGDMVPVDFTQPAALVKNAVVHIRSTQTGPSRRSGPNSQPRAGDPRMEEFFEQFFGPAPRNRQAPQRDQRGQRGPTRMGTGSGVIISQDGYIVTNNHVIDEADDIEVTMNDNRSYKARLIGADPRFDLALLKIDDTDLPTISFVNSDEVKVGEWVLAVGNPFDLTSTVTAGIVSAKGRSINILQEDYSVESFIQTDAAINPGNSGGALVDLNGGLIGINTAIASPTGSYSGYGFAVPANLVSKVVEDLIEYGTVQRGFLGAKINNVNANFARDNELSVVQGVYVAEIIEGSSAGEAGVEAGDVIVGADGATIKTSSQLLERLARKRPGDIVTLLVNRGGTERSFDVTLLNQEGNTDVATAERANYNPLLGAEVAVASDELLTALDLDGGVEVKALQPGGKLRSMTNVEEGFVITEVDRRPIRDVEDLEEALEKARGGVMIAGKYPDSRRMEYYAFGL